nr:DNA mismatch repair endonuclease MutL [uncultured Peptostreptococcus sp.]
MTKINILDDMTINKIAAGEVIERPSSIVKELVENSLDAGATNILIEIENAGKDLIKIIDNGSGIDADDINKAFLRHATSKIKRAEDLNNLHSLGFRGEALASIAAVAKVEMLTKTSDALIGTRAVLSGGQLESKTPVSANRGTQLLVRDLFYNTPARRKFLKSNHAEIVNITDLVNKLAIGNPGVSIKYINNGKLVFETIGDFNLYNTIRMIYGKDTSDNLIKIDYDSNYYKISGYIANNNVYRSNRNNQLIFINGRYVKSPNIMDTINSAYKDIIPINKYPVYFINLEFDPARIDVNIHPSKLEVKFDNEGPILENLGDYIRGSLLKNSLVGRYRYKEPIKKSYESNDTFRSFDSFSYSKKEQDLNSELVKENMDNDIKSLHKDQVHHEDLSKNKIHEYGQTPSIKEEKLNNLDQFKSLNEINIDNTLEEAIISNGLKDKNNDKEVNETYLDAKSSEKYLEAKLNANKENKFNQDHQLSFVSSDGSVNNDFEGLNYVGILFKTYILFSKEEKIYMIDQHAAHERVRFEMYMKSFKEDSIRIQYLLEPIIMELSPSDMEVASRNISLFERYGFMVEVFGHKNISVRGLPNTFGKPESEKFIYELIDKFMDLDKSSKKDSIYDSKYDEIAEMACKSAIKANDKLDYNEVIALVESLKKCNNPYTCPHGRPVMVSMTKYDIEKMFKRKM